MSAETFSLWKEKRFPNPDIAELERIAEAMKVSPLYLISEDVRPDGSPVSSLDAQAIRKELDAILAALAALVRRIAETVPER